MIRALLISGRPTKTFRATHHQGDLRYGATAGIQCSCMSLRSVCCNTFTSVTTWDGTDLDMILENEDRLFKSLNQYRLLGVDDLRRTVNIYGHWVDILLLDNKTGEMTLNAHLISLREIIESCLYIESGALLTISRYIFRIFGGKDCVYLFASHSKDSEINMTCRIA